MADKYSTTAGQEGDHKEPCVESVEAVHDSTTAGDDAWSIAATKGSKQDSSDNDESPDCKHTHSTAQDAEVQADSIHRWLEQLQSEDPWAPLGIKPSTTDPAFNISDSSKA